MKYRELESLVSDPWGAARRGFDLGKACVARLGAQTFRTVSPAPTCSPPH